MSRPPKSHKYALLCAGEIGAPGICSRRYLIHTSGPSVKKNRPLVAGAPMQHETPCNGYFGAVCCTLSFNTFKLVKNLQASVVQNKCCFHGVLRCNAEGCAETVFEWFPTGLLKGCIHHPNVSVPVKPLSRKVFKTIIRG